MRTANLLLLLVAISSVRGFAIYPTTNCQRFGTVFPKNTSRSENSGVRLGGWGDRLRELQEYKEAFGDCLVPHRYDANPSLGNWVNKQRQLFSKFKKGAPSSMTEQRIAQLEDMGFVWDASRVKAPKNSQNDQAWWKHFEELKAIISEHDECSSIPSTSALGFWVNAQRNAYEAYSDQKSSPLTKERVEALQSIGFEWKSRREQLWDERIRELREYKDKHGDCIVPISHDNKKLANWVSNQRKQYNLRAAGRASSLTARRIEQLESMGFAWDRWEYEFYKKGIELDGTTSIR